VRSRSHRTARGGRTASGRRVAPTSLRVALVAILSGALVALAGASGGFWMCVPGVMFAASLDDTALGAVYCTVPILVGAVLVARGDKGAMPPLWEAFAVVGLSIAVMHWVRRRLGHERDVMEHAALSDPLTGLANRRMLMSMAEYEIARHRRAEGRFVVVMLDLNGFKRVNDRHGHAAGDQLLCEVAAALAQVLRSQDTVARLGGDEFCVIAPDTDNPRTLAEKVRNAVAQVTVARHESLTTTVGFSVFPDDGTGIETLLRIADDRLLAAKRRHYDRPRRRIAA
jgi:diguanylate cyclase (GGDEF)-like protein